MEEIQMKYLLTVVWTIVCAVVLFIGHSYWKERTTVKGIAEKQLTSSESEKPQNTAGPNFDDLLAKTKNWPEPARTQFEQALKQNQKFTILFVGSKALGSSEQGMLKDVVQEVSNTYGQEHIQISIHTYDETSKDFLANNRQQEMAAENAQMIIYEPFLLNNNGKSVPIGECLNNLTKVISDVQAANPNTTIILMPSFPLYNAKYYPNQEAKLKQYAEQNQLAYLDHWTAWPDTNNPELQNDLLPDLTAPNDKGNQIWSQYLIHYLIAN